jgi:phosphoenolpyruvate carboxykinase (GTP)
MALRLASWLGQKEGWLAEHMLILGLQDPDGNTRYITGAFPSACGKTNLAMLVPPASMPGWKVWTVGDDIAWLRKGDDGRLWAVNPENGFFGVVPGTSRKTNPTAMEMIQKDTIYTNVALRPDGTPWWEGHDDPPPKAAIDWQGRAWTPESGTPAAHPNSRFTSPASRCATLSPEFANPKGVPIDAMLFGARRQRRVPLVFQARSWNHGTFLGATLSSETTAAATGKVGVLRRDPMAMWPFCGYNMGDYFRHWIAIGNSLTKPPQIVRVNWFRTGENGKFLWPGFSDNLRVLKWILERCAGKGAAIETVIGMAPAPGAIDVEGRVSPEIMTTLLKVDPPEWVEAVAAQEQFFNQFGSRLPVELHQEHERLAHAVAATLETPETETHH